MVSVHVHEGLDHTRQTMERGGDVRPPVAGRAERIEYVVTSLPVILPILGAWKRWNHAYPARLGEQNRILGEHEPRQDVPWNRCKLVGDLDSFESAHWYRMVNLGARDAVELEHRDALVHIEADRRKDVLVLHRETILGVLTKCDFPLVE